MSAAAFRSRFPVLERRVHLSSCSLGARSVDLDRALLAMAEDMTAGAGAWEAFEEQSTRARRGFAALVGADVGQIALVPSASVGAYQVASTTDWGARPKIVTGSREFPSLAHVWLAQRPRGAEVVFAGDATDPADLVDERTRLLSVPLVGYRDARRTPVAELAVAAHSVGADVLVDAYQAVGVEPVDVDALGCDFLVAGTMKYLLGLPGLAFLYARAPALTDCAPQLTGWFGRRDPFALDPTTLDFPTSATRFETGTPAVPACYAANAGLGLVGALDLATVRAHVGALTGAAVAGLEGLGETVRAVPPASRGAHIGLVDADPPALARRLAARGVSVSPRGDVVRVAFHYFNTVDDVHALCEAVAAARRCAPPVRAGIERRSHVHG